MAGFNDMDALIHHIDARLFPNHLAAYAAGDAAGKNYRAKVALQNADIDSICENMASRGDFRGDSHAAAYNVHAFLREAGFLLCDGWRVDLGLFSVEACVEGSYSGREDAEERMASHIRFRFRVLKPLRRLLAKIHASVIALERNPAWIESVEDGMMEAQTGSLIPGGLFTLRGHRIRISGSDPRCGLYFELPDGSRTRIEPLVRNQGNTLSALLPNTISAGSGRIVVITQYANGSAVLLKEPRIIASPVVTIRV